MLKPRIPLRSSITDRNHPTAIAKANLILETVPCDLVSADRSRSPQRAIGLLFSKQDLSPEGVEFTHRNQFDPEATCLEHQ
jgi:hypothetical protein